MSIEIKRATGKGFSWVIVEPERASRMLKLFEAADISADLPTDSQVSVFGNVDECEAALAVALAATEPR